VLGNAVSKALLPFGFPLYAWSRTRKASPGVVSYAGIAELDEFLAKSRVLVCLLPATADTASLLDRAALGALPSGAHVVNVARGGIVVEEDLIALLDNGHLAGATLDVFREEPLPPQHRFWHHPRVALTPHVSAVTHVGDSIAQVAAKIRRLERGEPVTGVVDRVRGY
jgi:glyoxylate/hydroxypyruvate reductase